LSAFSRLALELVLMVLLRMEGLLMEGIILWVFLKWN
jgi:hypothetical protein